MQLAINSLAKRVIQQLQSHIASLGFTPVVHFELEGCYHSKSGRKLNFDLINQQLASRAIAGRLIPEYWHQQWEYVSLFNGQSPLMEAQYLDKAIQQLPELMAKQGIEQTLIQPVVWAGDTAQLAAGSKNIFTGEQRAIHIPNAIQMNVSVNNQQGDNIIGDGFFGEYLQYRFINTSLACSLLYLPEQAAFERFELKSRYGLAQELCSPNDISGGHQGSIALYKQYGKHNQAMGEVPLVYDQFHRVMISEQSWHKSARIEHRLGASSSFYNPYINVVFALLNIIDALEVYLQGNCRELMPEQTPIIALPQSLESKQQFGAIELFAKEQWFAKRIDEIAENTLGQQLKAAILTQYQPATIIVN